MQATRNKLRDEFTLQALRLACEEPSPDHESRDAAFVCYVRRPNERRVELACGGFSGRATGALAARLPDMVQHLRPPQFVSETESREVGLFVVQFTFPLVTADTVAKPPEFDVVGLDDEVVARRCGGAG